MPNVSVTPLPRRCHIAIVGAGAAGLMTAIQARGLQPRGAHDGAPPHVVLLDGASKPGAKILVSGGSRCNVTNTVVTERDFWGGKRTIIRRVLRALPVADIVAFFDRFGVALREEDDGKLFPATNRSRDVLDALLRAADEAGIVLMPGTRVTAIGPREGQFEIITSRGTLVADVVVLATGGRSLPKTGSDGAGYDLARALGHTLVPTTPALAPLILDEAYSHTRHATLSGVSQHVEVSIWVDNALSTTLTGALLWTHFGVSGPVILNASRHWARAALEDRSVRVTINHCPGESFSSIDDGWVNAARERPTATVRSTLAAKMPDAVADALLAALSMDAGIQLAQLTRDDRRRLVHALSEWPLAVKDTRGYNYAEVTAGGVDLSEIDPSTMESRKCPGLFLVGEILDVDGRLGGFNFQWSWSSGTVAGAALRGRHWLR